MHHKCACKWKEECRNIQKMHKCDDRIEESDPRKDDCFKLNLVGDSPKQKTLRSTVLNNLFINPELITGLKNRMW